MSLNVSYEGDYSFTYLGSKETLSVTDDDFNMIRNLGMFTDAYNLDEPVIQDGSINLYYGSGTETNGARDYDINIDMNYTSSQVDDYTSDITSSIPTSWENTFNITDQFLTTSEIEVTGSVFYHQLFDLTTDIIDQTEIESIFDNYEIPIKFGIKLFLPLQ